MSKKGFEGFSKEASEEHPEDQLEKGGEKHEVLDDEGKEKLIGSATSFDELYASMEKIGSIPGKAEWFDAQELIDVIEKVRTDGLSLREYFSITTYGLFNRVAELLKNERESA